jgi:hypothetical protein
LKKSDYVDEQMIIVYKRFSKIEILNLSASSM